MWKPLGFGLDKDVDHVDGNKEHNYSSNLQWTTRRTNIKRAYKIGLKVGLKGDAAPSCVYSDEQVRIAFGLIADGKSAACASKESGIPQSYLYTMLRNEIRQDIYQEFDFSKSIIRHDNLRDKKTIRAIRKMYNEGYSATVVATKYGVTPAVVYNICKKRDKKK